MLHKYAGTFPELRKFRNIKFLQIITYPDSHPNFGGGKKKKALNARKYGIY